MAQRIIVGFYFNKYAETFIQCYHYLVYGGPDGELGASLRYLSQRFAQKDKRGIALLTDIGTEELSHLEMIGSIVTQLTKGEGAKSFDRYGNGSYYIDHANGVYPASAAGVPFTAAYLQSKADPIADIMEDMAAEQKARATYDNILRISDDPDVNHVIRFLREREIVHFQRFGDAILTKLRGFWGEGEGRTTKNVARMIGTITAKS